MYWNCKSRYSTTNIFTCTSFAWKKYGKLVFDLTDRFEKEYTSVELKYAMQLGYKITKIYSVFELNRFNGLMKTRRALY